MFSTTGLSEKTVLARLRHEFTAMKAVDHIKGFPAAYGVVRDHPKRSIIMELLSDHRSTHSYTLHDVVNIGEGERPEKHQILKV